MKKSMNFWIKAFVIGSSLAVFFVPMVVYFIMAYSLNPNTSFTVYSVPMFLPFALGILNIAYFKIKDLHLIQNTNARYLLTGLIFGLILASLGTMMNAPSELFQIPEPSQYIVLLVGPLTYALVWRVVGKNLNHLFELE